MSNKVKLKKRLCIIVLVAALRLSARSGGMIQGEGLGHPDETAVLVTVASGSSRNVLPTLWFGLQSSGMCFSADVVVQASKLYLLPN